MSIFPRIQDRSPSWYLLFTNQDATQVSRTLLGIHWLYQWNSLNHWSHDWTQTATLHLLSCQTDSMWLSLNALIVFHLIANSLSRDYLGSYHGVTSNRIYSKEATKNNTTLSLRKFQGFRSSTLEPETNTRHIYFLYNIRVISFLIHCLWNTNCVMMVGSSISLYLLTFINLWKKFFIC